jgi:hypothetical protein
LRQADAESGKQGGAGLTDVETRWAEAVLGKQVEEFVASDIGKVLLGMAEQEKQLALKALATVHPWRRRKIRDLQSRIAWAESFEGWLLDLIHTGRIATKTLDLADYDE